MKTVILILFASNEKKKLNDVKNNIISYVGTRMLDTDDETPEEAPIVVLNATLEDNDKRTLAMMCHPAGLAFVEGTPTMFNDEDKDYIDAELKE